MSTLLVPTRRGFLAGLFAAPAVIAAERLMPVRAVEWLTARSPMAFFVNASGGVGGGLIGSMDNPYRTLAAAMKNIIDGDTIYVAPEHVETLAEPLILFKNRTSIIGQMKDGHGPRFIGSPASATVFEAVAGVKEITIHNLCFVSA